MRPKRPSLNPQLSTINQLARAPAGVSTGGTGAIDRPAWDKVHTESGRRDARPLRQPGWPPLRNSRSLRRNPPM